MDVTFACFPYIKDLILESIVIFLHNCDSISLNLGTYYDISWGQDSLYTATVEYLGYVGMPYTTYVQLVFGSRDHMIFFFYRYRPFKGDLIANTSLYYHVPWDLQFLRRLKLAHTHYCKHTIMSTEKAVTVAALLRAYTVTLHGHHPYCIYNNLGWYSWFLHTIWSCMERSVAVYNWITPLRISSIIFTSYVGYKLFDIA